MKFLKVTVGLILSFYVSLSFAQESNPKKQWNYNYNRGFNLLEQDSAEQALPYLEKAYGIAESHFSNNSKFQKSLASYFKANLEAKKLGVIDSLDLTDKIISVTSSLSKKKRLKYSKAFDHLAEGMLANSRYSDAIALYDFRKLTLEQNKLQKETIYVKTLFGLGRSYKGAGKNNKDARQILEETLNLIDTDNTFNATKREDVLAELVSVYLIERDQDGAYKSAKKSLDIIEKTYGIADTLYTNALNNFGVMYWRAKLYNEAIEFERKAVELYEARGEITSYGYLLANYVLALIAKGDNNYLESISAFKKIQEIMLKSGNINNDEYAQVLGNIGLNYDRIGNYEVALSYCNESLLLQNISDKIRSLRLMDKAYIYQNMGRYDLSHKIYGDAEVLMLRALGNESSEFAKLQNNIGKLYFEEKKFKDALGYFKKALDIHKRPEGEKWHNDYSYMLNDYAKTLFELGQTDEAIDLMKKNVAYYDNNEHMKKDEAYYNRKSSLAKANNLIGNYAEALPLIKEATAQLKTILGEKHVDYGMFLNTLGDTYLGLGRVDDAISAFEQSNAVFIEQIDKIFRFSSEQEKKEFLNMITLNFERLQSIVIEYDIKNDQLNTVNLNNQLMLKGLLLNSSKDITIKLKKLNKEVINEEIQNYKDLKTRHARALTEYTENSKRAADSLSILLNSKEAQLVKRYVSNFEANNSLIKNWKSIKASLQQDEVAIEFAHFRILKDDKSTGTIAYVAYAFDSKMEAPKMIYLFESSQLTTLISKASEAQLYRSNQLYNLIWKPLLPYVEGKSAIYYAPSGLLNQISFAAIANDGKPLILNNNLIQLSSTDKISEPIENFDLNSSLLLGGVTYDYDLNTKAKDVITESSAISFLDTAAISNKRGNESRGESWTYLDGTMDEVENLNTLLLDKGTEVEILTKNEATETMFKSYSGQSPTLIHIATHGFFFENLKTDRSLESNLSKEDQYRLAEDPLLRSGLILAGANYVWKHGKNPFEEDDGILTALEIANLDLSNTNLVVLSACETGLGDIDGSEGVYGLQRAFKMAGVDQLIMSLWEVPDEETSLFMQTFYKYWLNGKSIRTAFINTQRELYKQYKNEPTKWAAFVLFE